MTILLFLVFQAKLRKHMIKLLISLKQSYIFVVVSFVLNLQEGTFLWLWIAVHFEKFQTL